MGIVIVLLAVCWAVGDGVSNATSSVRDNYRARRDRRHQAALNRRKQAARGGGPAPRSASTGVKVASGAATVAVGGFLVARGFVDGVRAGWPKGMERARRWADTRKNGAADNSPTQQDAKGQNSAPTPPEQQPNVPQPSPKSGATDTPKSPAAPQRGGPTHNRTNTSGGSTVSINTATGGEVHSYEQLLAELNSIAVEAQAELEDAQADAQRAREDAERIDLMVGSLTELELDQETLGRISSLADTASARLEAANARAVAADSRASGAMATAQHVQQMHQALAEAYASIPNGGAKKEFYVSG
ncbi:hypothetical protein ACQEU8_18590 [Streptomyces sp. CA-250714]|uniref:hypothetical protein n=1 Tax=Streptomyces sp. CA-250714 TaxID=3240060 RepID=UPI003D937883